MSRKRLSRTVFLGICVLSLLPGPIGQAWPDVLPHETAAPAIDLSPDALVGRILGRPLFVIGRRPAVEDHPAEAQAGPSTLRLVGTVSFSGTSRALVQADSAKPVIVGPGGSVAGYTISRIGEGQIEADGFGEKRTIRISKQEATADGRMPPPSLKADAVP